MDKILLKILCVCNSFSLHLIFFTQGPSWGTDGGSGYRHLLCDWLCVLGFCRFLLTVPALTRSPYTLAELQFRTSDLITALSLKPLLSQWWRASCVLVAACLSRASAMLPSPGQLPKLLINTDRVDFLIMGTSTVLNFNLLEGFRLLNLHG